MKNCKYCKEEIHKDAALCKICGAHQNPWKNRLLFISSTVGFFAVIGSLSVFFVNNYAEAKKTIFPNKNINAVYLSDSGGGLIYNSADGEIFLSHISQSIKLPSGDVSTSTKTIRVMVKSKDYFAWNTEYPKTKIISEINDEEWNRLLSIYESEEVDDKCYKLNVTSLTSPSYIQIKDYLGNKLRVLNADVRLHYYYRGENESILKINVPSVATLGRIRSDKCSV